MGDLENIPLIVQKSGDHQLRLVVHPQYLQGFMILYVSNGIP